MSLFERSEEHKSQIKTTVVHENRGNRGNRGNSAEIIDKNEVTAQKERGNRGNTTEIIEENSNGAVGVGENKLDQHVEPVSYAWLEVGAAAGMTDLTIDGLDHALFLFARQLVTTCPADEFMAMGHRYCPSWRARLHPEAWIIVEEHIRVRLKQLGWKKDGSTTQTETGAKP